MKYVFSCVLAGVVLAAPHVTHAASAPSAIDGWKSEICGSNPSNECVAANFDKLVQNAHQGNPYAINAVYGALSGCAHAPHSPSDIQNARVTAVATDQATAEAKARSALNSVFVTCQYFTPAQSALLPRFAWAAARHGNAGAQNFVYSKLAEHDTAYASGGNAGTPASLISDIDASAKAGNALSLLLMSEAYRRGDFVPVDNVKAYAYFLAWNKKAQATTSMPARLQGRLSTDQIGKAQQMASNLVASSQ